MPCRWNWPPCRKRRRYRPATSPKVRSRPNSTAPNPSRGRSPRWCCRRRRARRERASQATARRRVGKEQPADAVNVAQTLAPPDVQAPPSDRYAAAQTLAGAQQAAVVTWQGLLLGHLERHRRYPHSAERLRQQGVAYVRFAVGPAGQCQQHPRGPEQRPSAAGCRNAGNRAPWQPGAATAGGCDWRSGRGDGTGGVPDPSRALTARGAGPAPPALPWMTDRRGFIRCVIAARADSVVRAESTRWSSHPCGRDTMRWRALLIAAVPIVLLFGTIAANATPRYVDLETYSPGNRPLLGGELGAAQRLSTRLFEWPLPWVVCGPPAAAAAVLCRYGDRRGGRVSLVVRRGTHRRRPGYRGDACGNGRGRVHASVDARHLGHRVGQRTGCSRTAGSPSAGPYRQDVGRANGMSGRSARMSLLRSAFSWVLASGCLMGAANAAPRYVDARDYPAPGAGAKAFDQMEASLIEGFNHVCGDTFCEGQYINYLPLRLTCSVRPGQWRAQDLPLGVGGQRCAYRPGQGCPQVAVDVVDLRYPVGGRDIALNAAGQCGRGRQSGQTLARHPAQRYDAIGDCFSQRAGSG